MCVSLSKRKITLPYVKTGNITFKCFTRYLTVEVYTTRT